MGSVIRELLSWYNCLLWVDIALTVSCASYAVQTITGAMSTLTPPIALEHPANQNRVDYIQDVASQHDFDYPPVSRLLEDFVCVCVCVHVT
jgi:hypothetical protein